jgi:hypothetical protein
MSTVNLAVNPQIGKGEYEMNVQCHMAIYYHYNETNMGAPTPSTLEIGLRDRILKFGALSDAWET